jgi:hypothetical protein
MSEPNPPAFVCALDTRDTASWHQPITQLRDWNRRRIVDRVVRAADDLGFERFLIFDVHEDQQAEGNVREHLEQD